MDLDTSLPWRDIEGEGFNAHIGPIRFADAGAGRYCAALGLQAIHLNVGGVCHGGVLLAFADTAMGTATFSAAGGQPCATIDLDAHFLAAAKQGQTLIAEVRQLRAVRELSFMACDIHAGGRQVMRANGIWKYLGKGRPPDRR